jgi:isoleucyl-tRNA synthetase
MTIDYKNTVFLPKTVFPMRGGLPQKEPELLALWKKLDLHSRLRAQSKEAEKFILHDGPPYANGNLHIGHAVNKILKDVVNRCYQMLGYNAHYVPGWDCHGLPIEWKIEEKYREAGKDKDQVPVLQFRKECREFAAYWQDVQSNEFQRLGVLGDWEKPYSTMTFDAEAGIVREIHKFALNGGLFRDAKPVMWSTVEKTALAEAEVEYHDIETTSVYVKFPVVKSSIKELEGAAIVIWTTTPWTLPSNRAIAYGEKVEYVAGMAHGVKLVIAKDLLPAFSKACGVEFANVVPVKGDFAGTIAAHPLRGQGYDYDVPLLPGDFVTTESGTGFVHIAPGHGEDDYWLGRKNKLEITDNVDDEGKFRPHVPLFAGKYINTQKGKPGEANKIVIEELKKANALVGEQKIKHSYPHSWRSKGMVIFRTTPQWFISMEKNDLRKVALQAISDTQWFPKMGENRIRGMIEQRPDWCISRQRTWGVPIAIFVSKKDNQVLVDEEVFERIAEIFEKEGADAWFARPAQDFLGSKYKAEDFDQVKDIVDVWFESGSSHAFVLEEREDLRPPPADLYLEGSDQHRGWFHSSLLESCGTRGRAPYEAVLTHGFALDEQGRKMSKSLGNVVAPQEVTEKMGADILRLWVVGSDYSDDLRVGPEILKQTAETYRRLRNTLRYLLGALDGFADAEKIEYGKMPELEKWVLHRLFELDEKVRTSIEKYEFTSMMNELHTFCAVDLSAFYFDIRKDSLYCDRTDSDKRRAARTVMNEIFNHLTRWLAPVVPFTAEEAWQARLAEGGKGEDSIHLCLFMQTPEEWKSEALAAKWKAIRIVRESVTRALERKRADKVIGSSLEAVPVVEVTRKQLELLKSISFQEVCITSDIEVRLPSDPRIADLEDAIAVPEVKLASGTKCERCWRVLPEVGKSKAHPTLCLRCDNVVSNVEKEIQKNAQWAQERVAKETRQ